MESTKLQLVEQLTSSAVELLSKHNVPQSEMYEWIKDALRKHVDGQPPVKVLYNNCYGGYTLSKPFKAFKAFMCDIQDFTASKEERMNAIQHIAPFASSILDSGMYKGLREILYLYHYYDFGNIMSLVRKVIQLEKDKLNVIFNIENIRMYVEDPASKFKEEQSSDNISLWALKVSTNNYKLEKYTKQQLQDLLVLYEKSDFLKETTDTLTQATNKLTTLLGKQLYDEIDKFVEIEQNNECGVKYTHSNWWSVDEKNKFKAFVSLLKANGYINDLVWRYQKFYDKYAIKFIIMEYASQQESTSTSSPNEDNTIYDFVFKTHIPLKQDVVDKVEETFGLLCASGPCSQLAIAAVPPLLEWRVGDYDGLENVYVV